jgi:hypothetical protein
MAAVEQRYRQFFRNVPPEAPSLGLASGWTAVKTILEKTGKDELLCRPAYVTVFNLRLCELAEGAHSLADLAVTDGDGEYKSAEALAQQVGIATLLPADVPAKKRLASTFDTHTGPMPRQMLLLEALFSATTRRVVGLRIHNVVFQDALSLTRHISLTMESNEADARANAKRTRPLPLSHDPRFALGRLTCESGMAGMLAEVFDGETTAVGGLDAYAMAHPHASHISFKTSLEAPTTKVTDHALHPYSPELLLEFGAEALKSRTATDVCAAQLLPTKYIQVAHDKKSTFAPPARSSTYVFSGNANAMTAPFPPALVKLIAAAHEHAPSGQTYASYSFNPAPPAKRARRPAGTDTASTASAAASL